MCEEKKKKKVLFNENGLKLPKNARLENFEPGIELFEPGKNGFEPSSFRAEPRLDSIPTILQTNWDWNAANAANS